MIHVICVAYERPVSMRILIDSFLVQTNPNWKLHFIHDGPASKEVRESVSLYDDPRFLFYESKTRNGKFGHPNRRQMLDRIEIGEDDFILMTNDDNYYVPVYIETMLNNATKSVGLIYYNTLHNYYGYDVHKSNLVENGIDMGAFIVRGRIAKCVGFKYNHTSADGRFAQECKDFVLRERLRIIYIDKALFVHN